MYGEGRGGIWRGPPPLLCLWGCYGTTALPSPPLRLTHMCSPHQFSLTITELEAKTYVRADITVPVITGNKALREPTHRIKDCQWKKFEQRMPRVAPSTETHNGGEMKGEFPRRNCWGRLLFNQQVPLQNHFICEKVLLSSKSNNIWGICQNMTGWEHS